MNLPTHSERPGRILGVIGGAVGLFASTRPFGSVDGVVVSLGRVGALDPGSATYLIVLGFGLAETILGEATSRGIPSANCSVRQYV